MGRADYYKHGSWNAQCWFCGFKFKAEDLRPYWSGGYVCEACWEPRQPQDFARAIPDNQTPPWTQPQPAWLFALDFLITEDSGTDFIAENNLLTETTFQPIEVEP